MIYTHTQGEYDFYYDYLENSKIIIRKHRETNEILYDADSIAKALGFENLQTMIESNEELENMYRNGYKNDLVKFIIDNEDELL